MSLILGLFTILVVIYSIFQILMRILEASNINLKRINIFHKQKALASSRSNQETIVKNTTEESHQTTLKQDVIHFLLALGYRIIIFLIGVFIIYTLTDHSETINYAEIMKKHTIWDANHYIRISDGYDKLVENGDLTELVFFPSYPWLIKVFSFLVPDRALAGLIISFLAYSLACVFIYKLVYLDFSKDIANKTLVFLNLFPVSYFFGLIMSESLFLLLTTMTLYFIRKHRWLLVGIFGALAAMTRYVGVFLVFPAFIEILEEYQVFKHIKEFKYLTRIFLKKVLPIIIIPCGTLVFLGINYKMTGDALYFLQIQQKYYFHTAKPFFLIFKELLSILGTNQSLAVKGFTFLPGLIVVLLSYLLLLYSSKYNRTMYTTWLLAYIIGNTSVTWPISLTRYFCCALPIFLVCAQVSSKRKNLYQHLLPVLGCIFGIFYVAFFFVKIM